MAYIIVRRQPVPRHAYFDRDADTFTEHVPAELPPPGGHAWPCLTFTPLPVTAFERGGGIALSHVGRVGGRTGAKSATDGRTLRVDELHAIVPPIDAHELVDALGNEQQREFEDALRSRSSRLASLTMTALVAAILKLRPGSSAILEWLVTIGSAEQLVGGRVGARWALDKDKVGLAQRLGVFPTSQPWRRPPNDDQPYTAGLFDLRARPSEASMMEYDSRIVPGFRESLDLPNVHADIREFISDEPGPSGKARVLQVLNVNATGIETWSGGDLLYYHVNTKSCVAVQYKILTEAKRVGGRGHTSVDDDMKSQMNRLAIFNSASRIAKHPNQWRLGTDSGFLKLCSFDGHIDPDDSGMIRGMYLPVSYAQLMIDSGHSKLGYGNVDRYFDNTRFIGLVKEGWLGTSGIELHELRNYCRSVLKNGGSLVVTVDHSDLNERQRQQTARDRSPNHHASLF